MVINSGEKGPFEIRDSTGKEFKEIYDNQGRLLFKNWNEIQGSPPITFRGYGKNLTECRIYGNTVQNGTPSPEAPVDVVGCGVRTVQLFEDKIVNCNIDTLGQLITNPDFDMYLAKVEQGVTYTASGSITGGFFTAKPEIGSSSYNRQCVAYSSQTFTAPITGYVTYRVNSGGTVPMFNTGSTALPYEPYGYKIPVTVSDGTNTVTTPVYIGIEPLHKIGDYADYVDYKRGVVVRRIKKLVLTGNETVYIENGMLDIRVSDFKVLISSYFAAYCNFYISGIDYSNVRNNNLVFAVTTSRILIHDNSFSNVTDFKTYLAAQYAAGTPVTVWYVLAEPEETPLSDLDPITPLKGVNTLSTNTAVQSSEMYIKGKIKSLATHMLVDSSGNILLTSNNYQLVTKEE